MIMKLTLQQWAVKIEQNMQLEQDDFFGGRDDEDLVANLMAPEEIEMQKSMLGAMVDQEKVIP